MNPYSQLIAKIFESAVGMCTLAGVTLCAKAGSIGIMTKTRMRSERQFCCVSQLIDRQKFKGKKTYAFAVDAFGIVERWHINLMLLDEPIVCEHDSSDRCHEYRIC